MISFSNSGGPTAKAATCLLAIGLLLAPAMGLAQNGYIVTLPKPLTPAEQAEQDRTNAENMSRAARRKAAIEAEVSRMGEHRRAEAVRLVDMRERANAVRPRPNPATATPAPAADPAEALRLAEIEAQNQRVKAKYDASYAAMMAEQEEIARKNRQAAEERRKNSKCPLGPNASVTCE